MKSRLCRCFFRTLNLELLLIFFSFKLLFLIFGMLYLFLLIGDHKILLNINHLKSFRKLYKFLFIFGWNIISIFVLFISLHIITNFNSADFVLQTFIFTIWILFLIETWTCEYIFFIFWLRLCLHWITLIFFDFFFFRALKFKIVWLET